MVKMTKEGRKRLTLVIPCYNEERTLERCVLRCLELASKGVELDIVIVDDCSTDGSLAVANELARSHPEISVVGHAVNQGKGAALRTGFMNVTGDYVGVQDADMEYDPLDYLILLDPLIQEQADVVYGSRYLRPDTRRVLYFWHTWMNRSLTFVSNMFTNLDITDMETCYKCFRREVISSIAPRLKENRFGFEPEITAYVAQGGFRVYECAIHYSPRSFEEGKKIGWKDGVRALYCIMHYSAHTAPIPMQILMYAFIGGVSALLNVLAFSILGAAGAGFALAVGVAFLLAAGANYFLCIAILFRHKSRWSTSGEVIAYLFTLSVMGIADYVMTIGMINASISPFWSKAWAACIGFIGNFVLRKYVVFGTGKGAKRA